MILAVVPRSPGQKVPPPEVKIVDTHSGEERYADVIALRGYERLGLNDYHLQRYIGAGSVTRYFILCATDAVLAVERDINDHLTWLIERQKFGEAWTKSGHILDDTRRLGLGLRWAEQLIVEDDWHEAGLALYRVLGAVIDDEIRVSEWSRWASIFIDVAHAKDIVDHLPDDGDKPDGLNDTRTQMLLNFLENDQETFVRIARKWNHTLFDYKLVAERIEDAYAESSNPSELQKVLAKILVDSGDPLPAVPVLLDARDSSVVELIGKYDLLPSVVQFAPRIMTVSLAQKGEKWDNAPLEVIRATTEPAVKLFVDGRHQVRPQRVVDVLSEDKRMDIILFLYLEELTQSDSFASNAFGDRLVQLYAEYDRGKLLEFLRKNRNYDIARAIRICEESNYIEELVYLLGRVGQNKRALKLITEDLRDPVRAIDFATTQNDPDLWSDLINFSMDKPTFVVELLRRVHAVDPVDLIKRIPEKSEIPGLGETLIDILAQKSVFLTISNGVLDVIEKDCLTHSQKLRALRLQGRQFDYEQLEAEGLDLSASLVGAPWTDIKTEAQMIGEPMARTTPRTGITSLAHKIRHLAYIISRYE